MSKIASLTAVAFLLSAGCAVAADDNLSPTTNPSSSGRPSAILTDNECQNIWNQALNQSESGMTGSSMQSKSGSASSNLGSSSATDSLNSAGNAESNAGVNSGSKMPSSSDLGSASASNTPSSNLGSSSEASSESGAISKQEAVPFVANFAMVDKNNDGQISKAEFQDGCKNGWVQTASGNSGGKSSSSTSGSNKTGNY